MEGIIKISAIGLNEVPHNAKLATWYSNYRLLSLRRRSSCYPDNNTECNLVNKVSKVVNKV